MSKINKILFVILVVVVVISVILYFNKNKKPSVSFLTPVEMVTEKSAGKYYTMDLSYPKSDTKISRKFTLLPQVARRNFCPR
jgi:hypothetical protein